MRGAWLVDQRGLEIIIFGTVLGVVCLKYADAPPIWIKESKLWRHLGLHGATSDDHPQNRWTKPKLVLFGIILLVVASFVLWVGSLRLLR